MMMIISRCFSASNLGVKSGISPFSHRIVASVSLMALLFFSGFSANVIGQSDIFEETDTSSVSQLRSNGTSAGLLEEAFAAEINLHFEARREFLEKIVSGKGVEKRRSAHRDLAQWSLGKLKDSRGRWQSLDDWIADKSKSNVVESYEAFRNNSIESIDSHKALAMFCLENGLKDQARVHFAQILTQEPDNLAARRALGYVRVGPAWMTPEQLEMVKERQKLFRDSVRSFGPKLNQIAEGLRSSYSTDVKAAIEELRQINSDLAIPAMELIFGDESEEVTRAIIEWLNQREGRESSLALARFGIFHPIEGIRKGAALALQDRPVVEYGAAVVDMVLSPFSPAGIIPIRHGIDGPVLGFQKSYHREGAEADQMFIANTDIFGAISLPQRIEMMNAQTENTNLRVSELLSAISGRSISPNSSDIWDWWYQEMETSRPETRRISSHWSNSLLLSYATVSSSLENGQSRFQAASISESLPRNGDPFLYRVGTPSRSSECFVAGTPVMTQKGLRPVESIRMGDIVLCKNIETGELAFRPVVRSTERTPVDLVRVDLTNETLVCTPGHLF